MEFLLFPLATGIASSFAHCIAMCGPLQLALRSRVSGTSALITYHTGRTFSYLLLGILSGSLGFLIHGRQSPGLVITSKVFIILLFLVFAVGLWGIGPFDFDKMTSKLANAQWFQRLSAKAFHKSIFSAGMLNGFLPCPTTYAALGWTLTLDSALKGAVSMLLFGIATFPSFIVMWYSLAFKKLWSGHVLKRIFALLFLLLAIIKLQQLLQSPAMPCCPHGGH